MNGKLIFFDVDGTIWDWKGNIPESAVLAIKQLKANGHHPVMCTGRARGALYNKKLEELGFDGIVAACGAHVEYMTETEVRSGSTPENLAGAMDNSSAGSSPENLAGAMDNSSSGSTPENLAGAMDNSSSDSTPDNSADIFPNIKNFWRKPRIIYEKYVDPAWVGLLIDLGKSCQIPLVLEGPEKHWVSQEGFEKDDFVDRMYEYMADRIVPLEDYQPDMQINKFAGDVLRCSDYPRFKEKLSEYYSFIEHGIVQNLDSVPGQEPNAILGVMEAVPYGVSKADGIRRLCEYLGVDPGDTYSVGDSANDIDMLEFTGTGIAMGNGSDSIKAVADYITTDIHEDGIFNAMKHFGLI